MATFRTVLLITGILGFWGKRGEGGGAWSMERTNAIVAASVLFLIAIFALGARSGNACLVDRFPSIEERAREAVIVVVATVGDLVGARPDDQGFFYGTAQLDFSVQEVLKGTVESSILTLAFEGQYTPFFREGFWGWSTGSNCAPDISRMGVAVLFLGGLEGVAPLRYDSVFQLGRFRWDPALLLTDDVLVQVQQAIGLQSSAVGRESWGALKSRFR